MEFTLYTTHLSNFAFMIPKLYAFIIYICIQSHTLYTYKNLILISPFTTTHSIRSQLKETGRSINVLDVIRSNRRSG